MFISHSMFRKTFEWMLWEWKLSEYSGNWGVAYVWFKREWWVCEKMDLAKRFKNEIIKTA